MQVPFGPVAERVRLQLVFFSASRLALCLSDTDAQQRAQNYDALCFLRLTSVSTCFAILVISLLRAAVQFSNVFRWAMGAFQAAHSFAAGWKPFYSRLCVFITRGISLGRPHRVGPEV